MALRLTARDRLILGFAAEHKLVLESQLAALSGGSVERLRPRLRALADDEYLKQKQVFEEPCYRIQKAGLMAVGSTLPVPPFKLGTYKHDVGLAWLWLAARRGAFGSVAEVLAERRLRSHDESGVTPPEPYAIRLGGHDGHGRELRHYPDLLLVDDRGRRRALELELSGKGNSRLERIIAGYGSDRRVDGVVYLVEANSGGRAIGRTIEATAGRMRLLDRVQVRLIRPIRGAGDEAPTRGRSRAPVHRHAASAEAAR